MHEFSYFLLLNKAVNILPFIVLMIYLYCMNIRKSRHLRKMDYSNKLLHDNVELHKAYDYFRIVSIGARLAQSVEHGTLNPRVVGSSPTLGAKLFFYFLLLDRTFFFYVLLFLHFPHVKQFNFDLNCITSLFLFF